MGSWTSLSHCHRQPTRTTLHLPPCNRPVYISYLVLSGAAVVGCYALYHIGRRRLLMPGAAERSRAWSSALPVLYSTFSALIGTQSVLFSKTLAVLLRATFDGDNQVGVLVRRWVLLWFVVWGWWVGLDD